MPGDEGLGRRNVASKGPGVSMMSYLLNLFLIPGLTLRDKAHGRAYGPGEES